VEVQFGLLLALKPVDVGGSGETLEHVLVLTREADVSLTTTYNLLLLAAGELGLQADPIRRV
jgi:hypothetical protein